MPNVEEYIPDEGDVVQAVAGPCVALWRVVGPAEEPYGEDGAIEVELLDHRGCQCSMCRDNALGTVWPSSIEKIGMPRLNWTYFLELQSARGELIGVLKERANEVD